LGTGSFGVVQLAIQKTTGIWYAVKKVEKTKDMKAQHRVSEEIGIMEGLAHRNICRLHETFVSEGVRNICISEYPFHHIVCEVENQS
jgi:serine/threonine protein kinase